MDKTPRGHIPLHFRVFPEDDQWVGTCLELGISTCADTPEEATRGIVEATTLYVETLQDEGELTRILAKTGLQVIPGPPTGVWEEPIPVPA